jgi:hypothetical protein
MLGLRGHKFIITVGGEQIGRTHVDLMIWADAYALSAPARHLLLTRVLRHDFV